MEKFSQEVINLLTNAAPNFNIANFYSKENLRRLEKSARQLEKGKVIEINFDKLRELENRGYKFADKRRLKF